MSLMPYSLIVNPPPKSKSHQSTKHQGRLTVMGGMHSLCGSKRCGIRIILPRQHVIHVVNRVRITKPHSPPRDPLSTPGIPSERQGRDAADGAGELPSSLESWGWISVKVPFCSVIRGLDLSKFFWQQTQLKPSTEFGLHFSRNLVTSLFSIDFTIFQFDSSYCVRSYV